MTINEKISNILTSYYGINDMPNPFGNGHINDTFVAGDNIIQRINTNIFEDYDGLMNNIMLVTDHLKRKAAEKGGDPDREVLTVVPTVDRKTYVKTEEGVFRVYKLIKDATSYDEITPERFYEAGRGFGNFQTMLSDFPADKLVETIHDFHNTRTRFDAFVRAVKSDKVGRADSVLKEITFVLEREKYVDTVNTAIKDGKIPLRVTHNDTKLNNVLLDNESGRAVCVLDLDTVMPGSLLFDYGDALRYGASTAAEDETDLSKVSFDLERFETFTAGFKEGICGRITGEEIRLLPFSVKLMTLECGMRFLTDYLSGDEYFKISRKDHNLDRARTQFRLVWDIEQKEDKMAEIVARVFGSNGGDGI